MIFSRQALTNHLQINHFNLPNGKHVAFNDFSHFSIIFPMFSIILPRISILFLWISFEKTCAKRPWPRFVAASRGVAGAWRHPAVPVRSGPAPGDKTKATPLLGENQSEALKKHVHTYVHIYINRDIDLYLFVYICLFIHLLNYVCIGMDLYNWFIIVYFIMKYIIYIYTHAKVYVMYIDLYICIKKIKKKHVHKIYLTKYCLHWLHTCV